MAPITVWDWLVGHVGFEASGLDGLGGCSALGFGALEVRSFRASGLTFGPTTTPSNHVNACKHMKSKPYEEPLKDPETPLCPRNIP